MEKYRGEKLTRISSRMRNFGWKIEGKKYVAFQEFWGNPNLNILNGF
jgi:hypothetical protein